VILGQATPGTTALRGGRWMGDAVPMTTPGTAASRCNLFAKIASVMAPLAAGVVASPGPS
jgi:hypothetical protein